jgi:hypothetical protein
MMGSTSGLLSISLSALSISLATLNDFTQRFQSIAFETSDLQSKDNSEPLRKAIHGTAILADEFSREWSFGNNSLNVFSLEN